MDNTIGRHSAAELYIRGAKCEAGQSDDREARLSVNIPEGFTDIER